MPVAFASRMRVQVTPCERYRLRVTTWGSGAPPHAVVLPGLSADWRALAPPSLGVSLHWTYKRYCVPLLGRLLLQPSVLRASTIRRFLVGSGRRGDQRFVARLVRHGISARPRALSARAIIWANQPRRWH